MIEEQLSSSQQLFLPYENEKNHYSTDSSEEFEKRPKNIKTKVQIIHPYNKEYEDKLEAKRKQLAKEKEKRDDELLCYGLSDDPQKQNILDKVLKFSRSNMRENYIKEVINEAI